MKIKLIFVGILVVLLGAGAYLFIQLNKQKSDNQTLSDSLSQAQANLIKTTKEIADSKISYQEQLNNLQAKLDASGAQQAGTTSTGNKFPNSIISKGAGDYKTVKLANGQIYYGIVSDYSNGVLTFTDIYYTQGFIDFNIPSPSAQQQISLVKRGAELDGTTNPMMINDSSVTSIETLGTDSQVYKAIAMDKSR